MSGERRDAACDKCDGRRRIVVPCADETCPNQHTHDCSAPCPQCGEKPAPTAAEVAAARTWFEGAALESFADVGFPETARHVRTLLAALDAAEATKRALRSDVWRVMPTEDGDGGEKWRAFAADRDMAASSAEAQATAAEERAESVHAAWSKCLKLLATAERERDEARAALKPFAKFNETVDAIVPDSSVILYLDRGSTGLRAGDFRRAAEILKEAPRG